MSVELNYTAFGDAGEPIVILHGLLGSSRNWTSIGKRLGETHRVYALDLRNHGSSPHTEPFTYEELAGDVRTWIGEHPEVSPCTLIGHSLGGKTAMLLACRHPQLVQRLVICDATVTASPPRWLAEFAAMRRIDIATLKSRQDAEDQLERDGIDGWAFRKFLLSNLERTGEGFRWKVNLDSLEASLPDIFEAAPGPGECYSGPALLIRGGESHFVPDADLPQIREHFPELQEVTLAGAGHNVHADAPDAFLSELTSFIARD